MIKINVTLDKTEKYFPKQTQIMCDDGFKRPIDGFKLSEISKTGKTAEIILFEAVDNGWNAEKRHTNYRLVNMSAVQKRIKFDSGKMIISIDGLRYQIGTYTEIK